jgi:hypothetical protein
MCKVSSFKKKQKINSNQAEVKLPIAVYILYYKFESETANNLIKQKQDVDISEA